MDSAANRRSAEQHMRSAEERLIAGDLKECKRFASQAVCYNPTIMWGKGLYAAAAALLAAEQRRHVSDPADPYDVLGLIPDVETARDLAVIETQYRKISGLLRRALPRPYCSYPIALAFDNAARVVDEAWAFLSDPLLKAFLDANLDAAAAAAEAAATAKANAVVDAVAAADAARAASTAAAPEGQQPLLSIPSSSSPHPQPVTTKRKNPKASNQASRRRRVESEPETQPNAAGEGARRSGRLASKPNPN